MQAAREAQEKNRKIKEKVEKGQLSAKELLDSSLPKQVHKEIIYVDKEVPVIQEVRILKDTQGTEMSVTDIIRQEIDKVRIWEYKQIPINEFSVKDLAKLGKEGWKFAFDLTPEITHSVKVTTLVFQRPSEV